MLTPCPESVVTVLTSTTRLAWANISLDTSQIDNDGRKTPAELTPLFTT